MYNHLFLHLFLSIHLLHGFQSAFQTVGLNHNKYLNYQKNRQPLRGLIPFGFIFIAVFHFINAKSLIFFCMSNLNSKIPEGSLKINGQIDKITSA